MKFSKSFLLCFISVLILCCTSCRKEEHDPIDTNTPSNTTGVTVAGRITNVWNAPQQYAQVTLGGTTVLTDSNGYYALNNVPMNGDRDVILINKSGYLISYVGITSKSGVQYINVVLQSVTSISFISTNGITVNMTGGGTLIVPPNALVNANGTPYAGTVQLNYTVWDNSDTLYRFKFPGYDHMASDLQVDEKIFSTYSHVFVRFMSGNTELKIDSTKTVTVGLPIPVSQQASAPPTATLCSFNTTNATWKEELTATRVGNEYRANVSHFSFWGCGSLSSPAWLTGRILDCNNNPIPNTLVYFDYDNYTFTGNDGIFLKKVPSGISIPVQIPPANGNGIFSQPYTVGPFTLGQTHDMGDIVLQCPSYLTGQLTSCNGTGVPGWIQASYGSQFGGTGMYTLNGNFNLPVAPNMNIYLRFITTQKIVSLNAVSPATNQSLALGNINCCHTLDTANTITINGGGLVNETFYPDLTESYAQFRQPNGLTYIRMNGTTVQGKNIQITGYFNGSGTGSYSCDASQASYLSIFVFNAVTSQIFQCNTEPTGSATSLNVIDYGNEIGKLKAYVSGTLISSVSTGSVPVTVTGKMNLARVPNMATVFMNHLTADGDGFLNQTINFDWCNSTSYNFGYVCGNYQSSEQATVLKYYGCANIAGYNGRLKFKGNGPGTYTAPNDFYTDHFSIRPEFNMATTKTYDEIVSGTLIITAYNPAGGLITGTYSGVFKRTDPVTGQPYTVNVTNATISSWHYPDQ